jgi:hypothetical protein
MISKLVSVMKIVRVLIRLTASSKDTLHLLCSVSPADSAVSGLSCLPGKMNIAVQLAGASFERCSTKESADFTFTVPEVQERN